LLSTFPAHIQQVHPVTIFKNVTYHQQPDFVFFFQAPITHVHQHCKGFCKN
jgi:hypothetical protein